MDHTLTLEQRIIVYRLDEIGDFILNAPLLRELRRFYPDAHIGLVIKPALKNLAHTCPYIDALYNFNPYAGGILAKARLTWRRHRLAHQLRGYDLALLPRWDADDAGALPLAALSRTPMRLGFSECVSERKRKENRGYNHFLTHVIDNSPKLKHEVEKNLHVLTYLGKEPVDKRLELWLTPEDRRKVILNKTTIALGVGASRSEKMWPIKNFIALSRQLEQQLGVDCVVVGGPKERELGGQLGSRVRNLAGELTLRESAALLEQCVLYVGNDTGPKHLAAAMGTPVFEITNGESADRFCAWGVPHQRIGMVTPAMCFQQVQRFYDTIILSKDATVCATLGPDALVRR